jgi:hypothetical protein
MLQEANTHVNATTGTPHGAAYVVPSGNVATATALATGRTVVLSGDVSGTSGSFDGTANATITTTVADDSHDHTDSTITGTLSNDTTGNAATATALATARTIGGVSFNGEANISLPGVDAAGDQDTSGNALTATTATKWAAATTLTLAGDLSGSVVFDGSDTTETLTATVGDNSHTHDDTTIDGLNASAVTAGTFANARIPTTMTGKVLIESDVFEADTDGSAAAPAFSWDSDPSMGLYRAAADCLAVGLNGETAFIATESTNNDGGSSGDGLVGISDYCGGIAGGSAARIITQDIEGIQVKRLAFDSSSREFKSDEAAWGLTDEQFMSIQPMAFTPNGQYVHEGVHYMIGTDGNGEQTVPPEGSLPIRRAGMIQEDVALVDLHLISEAAIDWQAISTATLEKVQRLMERVEALEAV